ncbi:isopeptide-forming domain-containing fimbrial protein [Enterococcus faecium]|uniref:isopeptide-forming domain-containing fimbrial protein n=2 Tax=Bacillati TaxID=1783272 RepID=UPI001E582EDA|nr:isopeptide-forming domain-containing fimbrial protein [Enterococcus faecium]
MKLKCLWMNRLKYAVPLMMLLSALLGLKVTNVFAEKVIVDPDNPIQNVKNNFIIPKEVSNAKATVKIYDAGSVQQKHLAANQGQSWGNINYLTDNKVALNTRYPSFQKNYGQTSLIIDNVSSKTRIEVDYGKIATYKKEKVNVKLVFSDIKLLSDEFPFATLGDPYRAAFNNANSSISKSKKRLLFYVSDNLYSGFHYHASQMNVQLVVTHEDGSPVNFDGDTFISFNSLNPIAKNSKNTQRGEYAYYHEMNSSDWYVTKDTVLTEQKSYYNDLTVVGGNNKSPFDKGLYWNNHYDELGNEKFNQATVSFRIKGSNPLFVVGGNFATWSSLSSATLFSVVPDQPEKTGVDKDGNDVNNKVLQEGDAIQYRIKQKVNRLGVDLLAVYDRFELIDNLPKEVDYVDAHVECGSNKKFDVSGEVTYDKAKHQVKYAAKSDTLKNRMKYDGETYELVINVKVNKLANQSNVAKNQGTTIINKVEKDTNIVTVYFPKVPVKEVQQNGKDVNGRNKGKKGTPTGPLSVGSEVQYLVTQKWHTKGVDIAENHYKQFSIKDPIEKRLIYIDGSAKVIDKSTGTDITTQGTINYDSHSRTLKWEASADFLSNNLLDGREIQLIFTARTPLNQELDIDNQAKVSVENIEKETNIVTIGVKPNLPQVIVPKTGSNHLVLTVIGSILFLTLASLAM